MDADDPDKQVPKWLQVTLRYESPLCWAAFTNADGYQWLGKDITPGLAVDRLISTITRRRCQADHAEQKALEKLWIAEP